MARDNGQHIRSNDRTAPDKDKEHHLVTQMQNEPRSAARAVAIVTGGSRGIGRAAVERLHAEGFSIVFTHSQSPLEAADVAATSTSAQPIRPLQVDAADPEGPRVTIDAARSLGPVRALVNNAGVTGTIGPLTSIDDSELARLIDVNLVAPTRLLREVIRQHAGGSLAIVNVSSIAAQTGSPGEYVVYAAAKAALETLTRGVAKEVAAQGIRVNAVAPGFVDTTIHTRAGEPGRAFRLGATTPLGRTGTAEEIADAIAWLISDESRYVVGETLHVTGGA